MTPYKQTKKRSRKALRRIWGRQLGKAFSTLLVFSWKLVFVSLALFIALGFLSIYLVNSEKFVTKLITKAVNLSESPVKINKLEIGKQVYRYPKGIKFENVKVNVRFEDKEYRLSWNDLNIHSLAKIFSKDQSLHVNINGLKVVSSGVEVKDASIDLFLGVDKEGLKEMTGNVQMHQFVLNKLIFSNFKSTVIGDGNEVNFDDFASDFYGGHIKGKAYFDYTQDNDYLVKGIFQDVDLDRLTKDNPKSSSKIKGHIVGNVKIAGDKKQIDNLNVSFSGVQGAEIKASLVKSIFQFFSQMSPYLPKFEDMEGAMALLKNDGYVPFEKANVKVQSLDEKNMYGSFELESKKYNLNFDVTSDIKVDGGVKKFVDNVMDMKK